jgi:hypothetical protein
MTWGPAAFPQQPATSSVMSPPQTVRQWAQERCSRGFTPLMAPVGTDPVTGLPVAPLYDTSLQPAAAPYGGSFAPIECPSCPPGMVMLPDGGCQMPPPGPPPSSKTTEVAVEKAKSVGRGWLVGIGVGAAAALALAFVLREPT